MTKTLFIFESELSSKRLSTRSKSSLKIGDKVIINGVSFVLRRIEEEEEEPEFDELPDFRRISEEDYIDLMYFS